MENVPKTPSQRDAARSAFWAAGLNYQDLTLPRLQLLRDMIGRRLRESGLMKGTYKIDPKIDLRFMPDGIRGHITCQSYYFKKREAVAFNADSFIGFAGWSDDEHLAPILGAFHEWVGLIATQKQDSTPKVSLNLPWRRAPVEIRVATRW